MKINLLLLCILILSGCGSSNKIDRELALKIREDKRLPLVKEQAEELIRSGLTAGDSYVEIWIRDLNTFIETACNVSDTEKIRESLITFFHFQGEDGNIPDGYTTQNTSSIPYNFIESSTAPQFIAHKNTVETDQESSLIQAIRKYIFVTGDKNILREEINNRTVEQRMGDALQFLLNERYDEKYGLLWGATTSDWGDIQPEHYWGVELDSSSHLCIDIYDNAMFLIALNDYMEMTDNRNTIDYWKKVSDEIRVNVRNHLWDESKQKFFPHIYLAGSPFPDDFDENAIHYHGGTAAAIEAGLLSRDEIRVVYNQMLENVKNAGAQTIGLTVYPPYPNGFFQNSGMNEYHYQNGGDWTWFGGRMIQQLIKNGFYEEAYESVIPMLDRVIKHNGFYEWWSPAGEPHGSGRFRGSAGVLWKSITMLEELLENEE